ncbi:MAG: hypothetical protein ACOC5T_07355 [Elusimicrobiota bacterium]
MKIRITFESEEDFSNFTKKNNINWDSEYIIGVYKRPNEQKEKRLQIILKNLNKDFITLTDLYNKCKKSGYLNSSKTFQRDLYYLSSEKLIENSLERSEKGNISYWRLK